MAPILDSWNQAGKADYSEIVFELAYDLLVTRAFAIDRDHGSLPTDVLTPLLEANFVVSRGDDYQFRHELVILHYCSFCHRENNVAWAMNQFFLFRKWIHLFF